MGFWRRFDEEEVSRDFAKIREAGLSLVRIFLTWEDFQPSHDVIDPKMLAHLRTTLDSADAAGLSIMPTLFTGHMSGANWVPGWAAREVSSPGRFPTICRGRVVPAEPINWYSDKSLRTAQARLATECATALAGHPALFAWDLGNENSNCAVPQGKQSARTWLRSITHALRKNDSKTPFTLGLHMEDLEQNRGLTPRDAAEVCDYLTMHGYPDYATFTDGPTDERLLPFLAQLTRFLANGMEVLFSEFGVPTLPPGEVGNDAAPAGAKDGPKLVTEESAASYYHRALRALHQSGASGALMWCYSDYVPSLFDQPPFDRAPHERTFGLFRADGSAKSTVSEVRGFSRRRPLVEASPRVQTEDFIDVTIEEYFNAPQRHLQRLFHRYCAALGETSPLDE
jgi:endo-1,4-beta-mannosidase